MTATSAGESGTRRLAETADDPEPGPGRGTPAGFLRRHGRRVQALLVLALLGQMALGLVTAAREQSPTADEPVYIGAAVSYVQQHDLRLNPEHPPLAKLLAAAGLSFLDVRLDPGYRGTQWEVGARVLYGEGNDPERVLWSARLPLIVLTLLFGLVVFAFARDLFGVGGGLLALALYSFSPDVIAHGSLATNDVPLAGFLLTTVWLLWRARHRPRWYLPLAGAAFGCALATKMTALPVLPVVLLLAALPAWISARSARTSAEPAGRWVRPDRRRVLRGLGCAAAVGVIAVAVVWASYLVVDPALRYEPVARFDAGPKRYLAGLLPFPEPYRDGLLVQLRFEGREFNGYLFGERYHGGRWYYLPAALLVKTPLGMTALWLGSVVALLSIRRLRPIALYLLLPLAILLPAAMTGSRSFGSRYAIWLPIFLAVAVAAILAYRRRWVLPAVLALVAFVAVSSLRTFPYYLPYSNEAFGGPANTYRHLNDSNVDWGQDLGRLGDYLAERGLSQERVWLVHKQRANAGHWGINAADPTGVPPEQVHGLLAISLVRLVARPGGYAALIRGQQPIATIGHTLRLYRIP
ncbi:ArnT family glycosyltransferase [Plantactinospora sp. CA-290183]|uniref:ArnT family glycosyltransferase n=1 Tax=Plantactinospora sp. CA-290183 TaxID=3240006 RepID=UPI003D8B2A05